MIHHFLNFHSVVVSQLNTCDNLFSVNRYLIFDTDQDRDLRSKLFMSSSYEKWRSEALYSDSLFSPKMLPRDSPGDLEDKHLSFSKHCN